ncbi:MAG: 5'-deoxynucleotidase [Ruminococcaceae bacterium]|nr:5'-deoxynucleotidase [Oscillospiraceae bacterium]
MASKDNTGNFFALLFRMKNIARWGLMQCTRTENLSEHSLETAFLAHCLAVIGVTKLGKDYDPQKIAVAAMYHDMSEVLTGDMPTPVKYYNDDIKKAYKQIEAVAEEKLFSLMEPQFREYFESVVKSLTGEERSVVKSADKLSAHIKCLNELKAGNKEFETACESTLRLLNENCTPELKIFIDNYLDVFTKELDKVTI